MSSNGDWGALASHDQELANVWDRFERLPDPGESPILDALCERKNISIDSLVRVGAKLSDYSVLAFAFPGGIKYRDMVTDKRWSYVGSDLGEGLKIVRHGAEASDTVIVAEGETDGARLTDLYNADVAIMPGGAEYFPPSYVEQLAGYDMVLVGLDQDEAGERGARVIIEQLPNAMRFPPTGADWCESEEIPPLPGELDRGDAVLLVKAGDLIEMEVPDVVSWFEHALLPVGGLLVLHGWIKSFKSFIALDMLASLAQGGKDWAGFEPQEEACKVAVIQYEIPWPFYQARVVMLRNNATDRGAFDEHFMTWQPLTRPQLRAGNQAQEDMVLRALIDAGVQVVMVDPIRRMAGVLDQSAEHEVRRVLDFFQRIQEQGITVVATHHDNKESAKARGGDPVGMTGSGAFGGDPDSIVSIELPRGDPRDSTRRNLHFTLRNAPAIYPRGMWIQEDGRIMYSTEAFALQEEGEEGEPNI